ncbi:hypothetical protein QAD02_010752 [Eretmocerus hayati]|uniref:Uncharacterized protein n=1 Tax=Eretmocerus hayati TaxID=131215 RepID=A0ACC2NWI7_9HYME|nr:hypothetical protein QAD02_010752 [Eretmocerus hayati]
MLAVLAKKGQYSPLKTCGRTIITPAAEARAPTMATQYVLLLSKSRRSSELFFFNSNFLLEMTLRKVFKGRGARVKMPTQTPENDDIRVKIIYNGEVQITYITAGISVDKLRDEMRTICGFGSSGPGPDQFTMKWVDDEGDPCRIASQQELDEALRLYELDKDSEITIHGKYHLQSI